MDQATLMALLIAAFVAGGQPKATESDQSKGTGSQASRPCGQMPDKLSTELKDIRFGQDRRVLAADQAILKSVAEFMTKHKCSVRIEGYSDSKPPFEKAATTRAETVRNFLVSNGVAADQIKAEGKGALTEPGKSETQKRIARIIL